MESEGGENFGCLVVLTKPLFSVRFCFVVYVSFGVFSIFSIMSFSDFTYPQYRETTKIGLLC